MLNYLRDGVNLLLLDLFPHPHGYSLADSIAAELGVQMAAVAPPHAMAYRVHPHFISLGRDLDVWSRPLAVGRPLPTLPLAISSTEAVLIDLEATYAKAVDDADPF
jgi:hypothetical protein